jgi:hypothetical protein
MIASVKVLSDEIVNNKQIVEKEKVDIENVQMNEDKCGDSSIEMVEKKPNLEKVVRPENEQPILDKKQWPENLDVPKKEEDGENSSDKMAVQKLYLEKKEPTKNAFVQAYENKSDGTFLPNALDPKIKPGDQKKQEKENKKDFNEAQKTTVIQWRKPDGTVTEMEFDNTTCLKQPAAIVSEEKFSNVVAEKGPLSNTACLQRIEDNGNSDQNMSGAEINCNDSKFAAFQSVVNNGNSDDKVSDVPAENAQDSKCEKKKSRFKRFRQRVGRVFRRVFCRGDKEKKHKHMKLEEEESVDEKKKKMSLI